MATLFRTKLCLLLVLAAVSLLPACKINVRKGSNGEDKKVDIETPVGGIHVSNDADVRDTGLPVYPGARLKQKEADGNEKSANVNISTGFFGLKVVAVEYESDDPPEKVLAFYRTQLKKYGAILECHTNWHGDHVEVKTSGNHSDSQRLTCEDDNGSTVELKSGTKDNQRIVAVKTEDKGSTFALVRVLVRGEDKDTI